jgi:hypothetical protein
VGGSEIEAAARGVLAVADVVLDDLVGEVRHAVARGVLLQRSDLVDPQLLHEPGGVVARRLAHPHARLGAAEVDLGVLLRVGEDGRQRGQQGWRGGLAA